MQATTKHFTPDLEETVDSTFAYVASGGVPNEMATSKPNEGEAVAREVMLGNDESDVTAVNGVKSGMAVVVTAIFITREANFVLNNVAEMVSVETKRSLARSNTLTHPVSVFIDVLHGLTEQGNVDFTRKNVEIEPNSVMRIKVPTREAKTTGKRRVSVAMPKGDEISGIADSPEVVDSTVFHGA